MKRTRIPTLLEERAALEDNALVERSRAGHCPHCGSDRVYVEGQETSTVTTYVPGGGGDGDGDADDARLKCHGPGKNDDKNDSFARETETD